MSEETPKKNPAGVNPAGFFAALKKGSASRQATHTSSAGNPEVSAQAGQAREDQPDSAGAFPHTQCPDAATDPGRGRRLAFDVGTVRIGVAMSDPDGILATPVETIAADAEGDRDVARALELITENFIVEVVVGLPVALRGNATASTDKAIVFAEQLRARLAASPEVPVRMVDERMSTMAATQALHASGVSARKGRKKIDQAAAVHILQGWLDARRRVLF